MREPLQNPRRPTKPRRPQTRNPLWLWALLTLLLLAGLAIWFRGIEKPERPAIESPAPVAEASPRAAHEETSVERPAAAPIEIPAPPLEPAVPLPALAESDPVFKGALTEGFGVAAIEQYLKPEQLIRSLVVTVDNLPRDRIALEKRAIQPTPGAFAVSGPRDELSISAANYARYTPFVTFIDSSNARIIVQLYRAYYPLLQQAYEELGNPEPSFNTRLVEVIDHLLATPEVTEPVKVVQKNVLYEYSDENLESLSSGRKILIRMGPAHAATIKRKLREIRAELSSAPSASTDVTPPHEQ